MEIKTNKLNIEISVIMSVYNGDKYLRECIDSILGQTFTDFEFIIVNDGSTDNTEKIILGYKDARITYIKNDFNMERVKSRNKAIRLAKGQYIAIMDSDDICLPSRFYEQFTFMQKNPNIDLCSAWIEYFGNNKINTIIKTPASHNEIAVYLLWGSYINHPTVFTKKSFFNDNLYDDDFITAEDYHLWVKNVSKVCYGAIQKVLVKYRIHSEQSDFTKQKELAYKIRRNYLKSVSPNLTATEIDQFIFSTVDLNIKEKRILINKILLGNIKTGILEQNVLKKQLECRLYGAKSNLFKRVVKEFLDNIIAPKRLQK